MIEEKDSGGSFAEPGAGVDRRGDSADAARNSTSSSSSVDARIEYEWRKEDRQASRCVVRPGATLCAMLSRPSMGRRC